MSDSVYKEFFSNSVVWKYFLRSDNSETAKCKLCKSIIKTTARSTKGLHVHLKTKHKIDTKLKDTETSSSLEVPATLITGSEPGCSVSNASETLKKKRKIMDHFPVIDNSIEKKISRMVSKDGLPFRVFCTSSDLRDLFQCKGYKLPNSPNSIKLMVMNYAKTLKTTLVQNISKLKEEKHRFTLTFDEWTSTRNRRYININIHAYVEGRTIFWNIGLVRINGSLPAETCITLLNKELAEYGLSLDKDIICFTTDGAKVMVKIGRLIKPIQQLCYAHGIQLAVLDIIYEQQSTNLPNSELVMEDDSADEETVADYELEEEEHDSIDLCIPKKEIKLALEYGCVIKKVRKVVKLFKNSPTKNDLLQTYIIKIMQNISLVLDCKTRWSSLFNMLKVFNKVKCCVSKALVDLGLGANPDFIFTEPEYEVLMDLEKILEPVKLAVEVLCRSDANLITAETTLRFVIRKLENINNSLAQKLVTSLRKRIAQRRTNLTSTLLYLHNPFKFEEDSIEFLGDETFNLLSKNIIRKEIINIVQRLQLNENQTDNNDSEDNMPLANLLLNSAASTIPVSIQDELEKALSSLKENEIPKASTCQNDIQLLVKKEMSCFESGGLKGALLQLTYNALMTVVPTSVEAERAFSAAGYLVSKVRSCLSDDTINALTFLRSHFQNDKEK